MAGWVGKGDELVPQVSQALPGEQRREPCPCPCPYPYPCPYPSFLLFCRSLLIFCRSLLIFWRPLLSFSLIPPCLIPPCLIPPFRQRHSCLIPPFRQRHSCLIPPFRQRLSCLIPPFFRQRFSCHPFYLYPPVEPSYSARAPEALECRKALPSDVDAFYSFLSTLPRLPRLLIQSCYLRASHLPSLL